MNRCSRVRCFVEMAGVIAVAALALVAGSHRRWRPRSSTSRTPEDGDLSTVALKPDGELVPGARVKAATVVMPMVVSPDKRFLYAASRSKPYAVHAYSIDAATGALNLLASTPLVESFPYISLDRTGA